ncbi:MAG: ROK family transcriptional regulator [Motiliproteus sp.]
MTTETQRSRADLGKSNRRSVLSEILFNAPIARTLIAENTGLTGASVSRITRDLINAGLVQENTSSLPQNRSGRRLVELRLNPNGGYIIGVGINAFSQWISLSGLDNNIIAKHELGIESFSDPSAVLEQVIDAIETMIQASGVKRSQLIGAGVAIGGAVEPHTGKLLFSTTMDWGEVDVSNVMTERLKIPICVETVPNALNLAETRFGIAKGCQNVVMINASLKMGASLLLDNHIRRGMNYSAGLVGKLRLHQDQPTNGSPLVLDDVAAGVAVIKAITGDASLVSGRKAAEKLIELKQRSLNGDSHVSEVFRNAGAMLSQTIDMIVTLLQPEMIIIAGPMASVPAYVEGVFSSFQESTVTEHYQGRIQVSQMVSEEGGRMLAFNEFLARRDIDLDRLKTVAA